MNHRFALRLLVSTLAVMLAWAPCAEGAPVVVDDAFQELPLGTHLELAYDPTGALTVEEVLAGELTFAPSAKEVPSFGYRKGAEWARFELDDRRTHARDELRLSLEYGQTDWLEVYDVVGGVVTRKRVAGDQVPLREWEEVSRAPTFVAPVGRATVLVRTYGDHSHQLPLVLRTRERQEEVRRGDVLTQSLFYGALAIMAAYNALLAVVTRSRTYGYYVGYLVAYGVLSMSLSGLFVFVQPRATVLMNFAVPWSIAAVAFFSTRFAKLLLALPERGPWSRGLTWLVGIGAMGIALASPFSYLVSLRVAFALMPVWAFLLIGSAVSEARRGSTVALTFLVAWLMVILGTLVNLGRVTGVLPTNVFTSNVLQVGSALEFLLLSLALAARIKELQATATANAELAARNARTAEEATKFALAEQSRINVELQRMDKLKDAFLANTSHELRTPLNGILGLIETTLSGSVGAIPSPVKRNLELVRASGRRLATLVNDILDFSKLRESAVTLREKPVALQPVVELTLQTLSPLANDKGLRLVNEVPESLGVRADENRLQQILTNLVGNAIKFTHEGHVLVRARASSGRVIVSVHDTGIGIARASHERIFVSFEQGDGSAAREHGGTGLGLAVTKQLVELHGGTIVGARQRQHVHVRSHGERGARRDRAGRPCRARAGPVDRAPRRRRGGRGAA
jgi:signal transduction histidine kinase